MKLFILGRSNRRFARWRTRGDTREVVLKAADHTSKNSRQGAFASTTSSCLSPFLTSHRTRLACRGAEASIELMESLRLLQIRTLRQVFSSRSTILRQSFRQISRSSQQPFRTRPSTTLHTFRAPPSSTNPSIFRSAAFRSRFRATRRRFQSTQPSAEASEQNLTLSQRLKKLSREYGWSAVGVYLLLSVLDFPFCFLAVRLVGVDKIGHWEHVILSYIRAMVKWPVSGNEQEAWPLKEAEKDEEKRVLEDHEAYIVEDHGYAVAEKANAGENASKYLHSRRRALWCPVTANDPIQAYGHNWPSHTPFTNPSSLSECL